jgi:hypothetical protein
MVDDVRDRAHSAATDQKKQQYGRMKGIAHAVRAASDDLSNQGQPMVAEYSRDVAEGLESMAQSLGRRDVDALVGSVEDFARAPSVALLGGAVVGGFAPACFFMKNSARCRHQRSDDIRQSYAASSGGRHR